MYSAFSGLSHIVHLKQDKCQCLSSATKDCPFFISEPQPPQSMKRHLNVINIVYPHGLINFSAYMQPFAAKVATPYKNAMQALKPQRIPTLKHPKTDHKPLKCWVGIR